MRKSSKIKLSTWFSRKVRQVRDGGFRRRTPDLLRLVSPASIPGFSISPWMRGAPHGGFSRLVLRISSRASFETGGRPGWPCGIFHVRNSRNPLRCQAIMVFDFASSDADRQSLQTLHSQAQKNRSAAVSCGCLLAECWSTPGSQHRQHSEHRRKELAKNAQLPTSRIIQGLREAQSAK